MLFFLFSFSSQSLFEINRQYWQDVPTQPTTTELRLADILIIAFSNEDVEELTVSFLQKEKFLHLCT